jgi:ornithine cyclodeaminase
VETRGAALADAGDVIIPMGRGTIRSDAVGELPDLIRNGHPAGKGDLTVFKSVGHAFEDLVVAAAILARLPDRAA